jgi:hypothetical protein
MAPAYISEGTQCTLLTLPGDVRSRIMEYALTSSAPLHLVSPLKSPPKGAVRPFSAVMAARLCVKRPILVDPQSETGDGVELNQIKFVCRQAYAETAGHELRFNDNIIAGEDSTFEQLFQFGEHIGSKTRWLKNRTITLSDLRLRYRNPGELNPTKILMNLFPDTADMIAKPHGSAKPTPPSPCISHSHNSEPSSTVRVLIHTTSFCRSSPVRRSLPFSEAKISVLLCRRTC